MMSEKRNESKDARMKITDLTEYTDSGIHSEQAGGNGKTDMVEEVKTVKNADVEISGFLRDRLFQMADRLKNARDLKTRLKEQEEENNAQIREIEGKMTNLMTKLKMPQFSREGKVFYMTSRLYAAPRAEKQEAMIAALKENGYGELVKETVHNKTLDAFAKKRIEESEDGKLPAWLDEVIETYLKPEIGIRKVQSTVKDILAGK